MGVISEPNSRRAEIHAGAERVGKLPGLWQAIVMVVLAGLACWFWALPNLTAEAPAVAAGASELGGVPSGEFPAALTTMDGSGDVLARWKDLSQRCSAKLAGVTIARAGNGPAGTVRLQSGSYFSPVFTLPAGPMRVAIPYPTPYETGHGTLSVLITGGDAIVALTPAWHIPANAGVATRAVTWRPGKSCAHDH